MSEREKKDKRIVKMELMYTSTRNANEKVTASQAILKGLAEDGGLFVPEQLPTLDKTVDELDRSSRESGRHLLSGVVPWLNDCF